MLLKSGMFPCKPQFLRLLKNQENRNKTKFDTRINKFIGLLLHCIQERRNAPENKRSIQVGDNKLTQQKIRENISINETEKILMVNNVFVCQRKSCVVHPNFKSERILSHYSH